MTGENISVGFERPAARMIEKGLTSTQGPQGPPGPTGPQGPQGPVPIVESATPPADHTVLWLQIP